ncbi:ALI_HP2_G0033100.mRNA.1.CDS.1 [Saccharomyces cerevisiae]|nr:ALI_HP2_G0033100.mRNA.1.CDS.1 [Saccharomyces cerevisiae]CAI6452821.1 ALI_HP1_G0013610.mRNA.1.CDS.1 [Saccharomyces cerevisiae]CAI6598512.1 ALI_collapsed_G0014430.mRNA.1.CDS.1 [Saccharomyces cerevisiae]CAI6742007.1 ALI_HP2_G0033100.mRNA.1.CDS.1 [Saccharomyces cerevisiae]
MSYNGIGLKSAKGSSTSGHVQRSLASNNRRRPQGSQQQRQQRQNAIKKASHDKASRPLAVQKQIETHMEKREIEVQVSELRDRLEEEETLSEEQIDKKCEALRAKLTNEWQEQQRMSSLYTPRKVRLTEEQHRHE